ncbi:hypothetical protein [Nocardia brasiliensis]|uniref:hypothetical protein n=1 Tax=Nocardia brasiliensis TaxID=37326 RepID=UPI002457C414|nr:hypothetical protein [Nocardia brasiliensis]
MTEHDDQLSEWEGPCVGQFLDGLWTPCGCECQDCLEFTDDLEREEQEAGR